MKTKLILFIIFIFNLYFTVNASTIRYNLTFSAESSLPFIVLHNNWEDWETPLENEDFQIINEKASAVDDYDNLLKDDVDSYLLAVPEKRIKQGNNYLYKYSPILCTLINHADISGLSLETRANIFCGFTDRSINTVETLTSEAHDNYSTLEKVAMIKAIKTYSHSSTTELSFAFNLRFEGESSIFTLQNYGEDLVSNLKTNDPNITSFFCKDDQNMDNCLKNNGTNVAIMESTIKEYPENNTCMNNGLEVANIQDLFTYLDGSPIVDENWKLSKLNKLENGVISPIVTLKLKKGTDSSFPDDFDNRYLFRDVNGTFLSYRIKKLKDNTAAIEIENEEIANTAICK